MLFFYQKQNKCIMAEKNIDEELDLESEDFNLENIPDNGKRILLDENGVNIYQKTSKEKTVEERIKT